LSSLRVAHVLSVDGRAQLIRIYIKDQGQDCNVLYHRACGDSGFGFVYHSRTSAGDVPVGVGAALRTVLHNAPSLSGIPLFFPSSVFRHRVACHVGDDVGWLLQHQTGRRRLRSGRSLLGWDTNPAIDTESFGYAAAHALQLITLCVCVCVCVCVYVQFILCHTVWNFTTSSRVFGHVVL